MNSRRRKQIRNIVTDLEDLAGKLQTVLDNVSERLADVDAIIEELCAVEEEERAFFDNLSERAMESERGVESSDALANLESVGEALSALQDALSALADLGMEETIETLRMAAA